MSKKNIETETVEVVETVETVEKPKQAPPKPIPYRLAVEGADGSLTPLEGEYMRSHEARKAACELDMNDYPAGTVIHILQFRKRFELSPLQRVAKLV